MGKEHHRSAAAWWRDDPTEDEKTEAAARKTFCNFLLHGDRALRDEEGYKALQEATKAFQTDSDVAGGYLVAPREVVTGLIENMDDMTYIRGLANVVTIERAQSLGSPVRENDLEAFSWGGELQVQAPQEAPELGMRELFPNQATAQIKISMKALQAPGIDPEALWLGRMAYVRAKNEEEAHLTGDWRWPAAGASDSLRQRNPHVPAIPTAATIRPSRRTAWLMRSTRSRPATGLMRGGCSRGKPSGKSAS